MRIPRDISVWFLCEASQLLIEHCSHPSAADGATLPRHLHRIFLAALLCLEPLSEGFSKGDVERRQHRYCLVSVLVGLQQKVSAGSSIFPWRLKQRMLQSGQAASGCWGRRDCQQAGH